MNKQTVSQELAQIKKLVGTITKEQLRYIDCFVSRDLGLFMPVGGACFYALTPEHTHPSYMFVLNFDDETSIKMNGAVISGMPGTIFALSPGVPHQELPSDRAPRYIAVMMAKDLFESQYCLYGKKKVPAFRGDYFKAGQPLVQLCKRFMIEADNRMPGSAAVLHALSVEICHAVIRTVIEAPIQKDRLTERVEVNRVIEYLHSNLDQKITLQTLAGIGYLSPSHFSRVFREETGQPPMEYVHRLRMDRAKKLLLAGDRSITEIALECGFNSTSYLSACFQKQYKQTPSEYQKRTKAG